MKHLIYCIIGLSIAISSCQPDDDILRHLDKPWVSASGHLRSIIIDDDFYIRSKHLIAPYKFEHIEGTTFQQSGADGYEIQEHRDYGLKPIGSSTMTIHADSMLTIHNFKRHRDTTSYTMEFMNLDYYTPRVVWDSIRVVNYGDHGHTEKMIIKDNLSTEKHHAITQEIAILMFSDIDVYNINHGMGIFHHITIYDGGDIVYDQSCTLWLDIILPQIILNKPYESLF